MWLWLERVFSLLMPLRRAPKSKKQESPAPAIVDSGPKASPLFTPDTWPGFRQVRRALEKAPALKRENIVDELYRRRLKHDKFVEPKGERPKPKPRAKREKKPKVLPGVGEPLDPVPFDKITGLTPWIAEHHEDDQPVYYEHAEADAEFNFRDTILEQLDRYFYYLERMKSHAPTAYQFYRQYGATILPYLQIGSNERREGYGDASKVKRWDLPPWFHATRPAFGCFAYGTDPATEKMERSQKTLYPRFMYFQKCRTPPAKVQPTSGGDVYLMTVYWDTADVMDPIAHKLKKSLGGMPAEYALFISADGSEVRALRTLRFDWLTIRSKKRGTSKANPHPTTMIPSYGWKIDPFYKGWAREHKVSAEELLEKVFLDALVKHESTQYHMIRVAVSKGDMTAVFHVNPQRLPYFFSDRDIELTDDGSARKKVFHIVHGYTRKNGSVVKWHTKGQRRFMWAGYDVHITIPGRDHFLTDAVNSGVETDADIGDEQFVDMEAIGKMLSTAIDQHLQPGPELGRVLDEAIEVSRQRHKGSKQNDRRH